MPAIAAIVLADGQATPVNHTFSPQDCTTSAAIWTDRSSGIDIGMPKAAISLKEQGGLWKLAIEVSAPVMEVVSGSDGGYTPSPKVAHTPKSSHVFFLPKRSTLQNRKDVLAYAKNILASTFVTKAVEEYERTF